MIVVYLQMTFTSLALKRQIGGQRQASASEIRKFTIAKYQQFKTEKLTISDSSTKPIWLRVAYAQHIQRNDHQEDGTSIIKRATPHILTAHICWFHIITIETSKHHNEYGITCNRLTSKSQETAPMPMHYHLSTIVT